MKLIKKELKHWRKKSIHFDVVVFGCTAVDIMANVVDEIPPKGSSCLFDNYELQIGGNAANVAVIMAKLGLKVRLITSLGNDHIGKFCRSKLKASKVHLTKNVVSKKGHSACSIVMVPSDGNRRIIHCPGVISNLDYKVVHNSDLDAKWFMVSGFFCLPALDGVGLRFLLKKAKLKGLKTCIDTAVNKRITNWYKFIEPAIEFIDIIFPSEEEAFYITGEKDPFKAVGFLRKVGIPIVGIKLAERGSVISYESTVKHIPAFKVEAIDSCGAGDAFMAGFIYALNVGESPERAALFGNALGSLCVESFGATSGIKSRSQVKRRLCTS